MRHVLRHTPLFAVDAVVLDTETTAIEPQSARVIEIAAVVIRDGAVRQNEAFCRFIDPQEPIPTSATAVHGIRDRDIAGAPVFDTVFRELVDFIGEKPVIGHTIGFDLVVLKRECELSSIPFPVWAALDTRLLAELAAPTLAGFSLETVAAWLGVPVAGRHRALGDALCTARVFLGLAPRLRERGIRTVGEAEAACRRLVSALEGYHRAGWLEPSLDLPESDRLGVRARLDSYPYRHRVRDIMTSPPAFASDGATVRDALHAMIDARISSLIVGARDAPATELGIVTERDILRAVRQQGPDALDGAATAIASRPLVTVPDQAFVYRAIGRMRRFNVRHLAAAAEDGRITGALSARDLLRLRADAAVVLGDDIDEASDVPALARAWAKVPAMAESLLAEGVSARDIAGIVARELGALTRRAGAVAEEQLAQEGAGCVPCAYALLVLGSAGRGESLLALDQDHAIVFAKGEPGAREDLWFEQLGQRIADILNELGVPYCPGGVMAGNAAFRGSLATWRKRIDGWIKRAAPEDLLNVDVFFDFRPVHGDGLLAAELWREAWSAAGSSPTFLRLMAEVGVRREAPIGFLGRLRSEEGRIDLKRHGLWPIVENARLLALRHGVARRATADRLEDVRALGVGGDSDLGAAIEAHERFLGLILKAQLADMAAGRPASNRVPLALIEAEGGAKLLKADLRLAASLDELAHDQISGVGENALTPTGE